MTNDKTELPSITMISRNEKTFDAIIVGGGHNGLVAASYLAKAGKAVLPLASLHAANTSPSLSPCCSRRWLLRTLR